MSGELFDGTCKVTVYHQPTGFVGANPQFFERTDNGVEIVEERIRFHVTKSLGKEPNKCVVKVTNLSPDTRAEIQTSKNCHLILAAGYGGENRLLFTGDVTRAWTERESKTDVVTIMHVGDGLRAFAHSRMNRSYRPPVTVGQILRDCAQSMGLQLPPEIERAVDLKQTLPSGLSAHGPTREILTRVLAPYGYHWSLQSGQILVLRDEQVVPGQAILVDSTTGLIDAPKRSVPETPKAKAEVKFSTLLNPELGPGKLVELKSEFIDASLKATDVSHTGDTRGDDWKTEVTGRPLR